MFETPWIAPEQSDLVWFSGADALRFLNDLLSQELADMASGDTRRSLLLEPQGKLGFILRVIREPERIGLVADPGRGEDLATTLGRYRIRVDVAIEPETDPIWVVMGDWTGYDVSWAGVPRHLVIGERPDLPAGSMEDYEHLRITAGEPRWGVDIDEGTIPHESGLVRVSVDFDKGCFLGQELVARIDSRGSNTPRNLRHLISHDRIQAGDMVLLDDVEVGNVTSATEGAALAMLKRAVAVGDTVQVGEGTAVVREPAVPTAR